ncbi:MAG: hypothetical protein Q9206_005858 [Seirophora lacunosa]
MRKRARQASQDLDVSPSSRHRNISSAERPRSMPLLSLLRIATFEDPIRDVSDLPADIVRLLPGHFTLLNSPQDNGLYLVAGALNPSSLLRRPDDGIQMTESRKGPVPLGTWNIDWQTSDESVKK